MSETTDPAGPLPSVAVMGMFRSGTNYARTVLEWNYRVTVAYHSYGWKHGLMPIITGMCPWRCPAVPLLVVSKDPFAALDSLYRYACANTRNISAARPFDAFLRSRISVFDGSSASGCRLTFRTPVDYYNTLYDNLLSARSIVPLFHHLDYGSSVADPQATFSAAAGTLGLEPLDGGAEFRTPQRRTRNMNERPRREDDDYLVGGSVDTSFYLEKKYLAAYSEDDMDWTSRLLDPDLMAAMGYAQAASPTAAH